MQEQDLGQTPQMVGDVHLHLEVSYLQQLRTSSGLAGLSSGGSSGISGGGAGAGRLVPKLEAVEEASRGGADGLNGLPAS